MAKQKRKLSNTHAVSSSNPGQPESSEQERVGPAPGSSNRIWREVHTGFYAAVPAVLALLTSLNSLWNKFAYDDTQQVLGNEFIKRLGNLPLVFTSSVWAFNTESLLVASSDPYYRHVEEVCAVAPEAGPDL